MEKELFKKKYQEASTIRDPLFKEKIKQSNEKLGKETKLVVCMEELSELFQVLSKYYRQKGEFLNLIEELGDQLICVESMRQFYGIEEEELDKAFQCAKHFVSEQKQDSDTSDNLLAFMKEVIEILHIFSRCYTEWIGRSQMLSTLCSLLICVDNLCQYYGISEGELNKDINVKMDKGISRYYSFRFL